jgi:pimeloyl-ACP methyl ester carboxylesterase
VTLCYETFGEDSNPAALLIMGLGTQMVAWPEDFCQALADTGLYVVRFDNRDAGRSTHFEGRPPTIPQLLMRSRRAACYSLGDMADDAAALLQELSLAPAHVIGASMGGMIAQTLAARRPQSVRSLVSIMSNTGSLRSGQPALRVYSIFLRRAPREREAYIRHIERVFALIGSAEYHDQDREDVRAIAAASFDRDGDPHGSGRQLAAIIAAGDRTAELRRIGAPTLVIHGLADPLVATSGGRATARAIPHANLLTLPAMGHDLPRALWPQLLDAIGSHTQQADAAARAAHAGAGQPSPLQTRPAPLGGSGTPSVSPGSAGL